MLLSKYSPKFPKNRISKMSCNKLIILLSIAITLPSSFSLISIQSLIQFTTLSYFNVFRHASVYLTLPCPGSVHISQQFVSLNGTSSRDQPVAFGVPQRTCFGPLLLTLYTSPSFDVINVSLAFERSALMVIEFCVSDIRT